MILVDRDKGDSLNLYEFNPISNNEEDNIIKENINRGEANQPIPTINNNYNRDPLLPRAEEGNT